jgi:uncharacterized membrane-anchored protein YitT (DUF2179 family)
MYIHLYIYNLCSLMIFWGCLILVIAVQIGLMCSFSLYGVSQKGKQSLDTNNLACCTSARLESLFVNSRLLFFSYCFISREQHLC